MRQVGESLWLAVTCQPVSCRPWASAMPARQSRWWWCNICRRAPAPRLRSQGSSGSRSPSRIFTASRGVEARRRDTGVQEIEETFDGKVLFCILCSPLFSGYPLLNLSVIASQWPLWVVAPNIHFVQSIALRPCCWPLLFQQQLPFIRHWRRLLLPNRRGRGLWLPC